MKDSEQRKRNFVPSCNIAIVPNCGHFSAHKVADDPGNQMHYNEKKRERCERASVIRPPIRPPNETQPVMVATVATELRQFVVINLFVCAFGSCLFSVSFAPRCHPDGITAVSKISF